MGGADGGDGQPVVLVLVVVDRPTPFPLRERQQYPPSRPGRLGSLRPPQRRGDRRRHPKTDEETTVRAQCFT